MRGAVDVPNPAPVPQTEPRRLSRRRRRQLKHQAEIRLRVGPMLYRHMEPGEQILAGSWGPSGRLPALESVTTAAVAVAAASVAFPVQPHAVAEIQASMALAGVGFLLTLARFRHIHAFLAVTDRQLICVRMAGSSPVKVLFRVPREAATIRRGPRGFSTRSVTYFGPGARARGLRFTAGGLWLRDLDEVIAELRAGGARVDGFDRPAATAGLRP